MSKMHWHAMGDLLSRYGKVFRYAWQHRKELDGKPLSKNESEFLPAALAIQETPLSPAPRVFMWLIMSFALIALLWASFGRIDIVATAQGKLIPDDRVKIIQALEPAKVEKILVEDGQSVKAGDVLLELDGTATAADVERFESEWIAARLQVARSDLLLGQITAGLKDADQAVLFEAIKNTVPEASVVQLRAETLMLDGEYQEYRSRILQLDSEIARRAAEQRTTHEVAVKLSESLPLLEERLKDLDGLLKKGYYPRHQYLEEQQKQIEMRRDLSAQKNREQEIQASLQEAKRQRDTLIAETRRTALNARQEAQVQATSLHQELIKAQQRSQFTHLTSPVDGVVQQLAVHTIGGVVTEAQQLMIIVPGDNPLIVDVMVQNKDIGFVHPGQAAVIKVETFPFTTYGTIDATVTTVSNDAIQDEKLGLIYPARLKLSRSTIAVEDKIINLSAGMAVSAEMKTGKRRVIEFFLSPLMQYKDESLHER